MRRFYEVVWDKIHEIINTGLPPINDGATNKWTIKVQLPPSNEIILPETMFGIKLSPLSFIEQTASRNYSLFDSVDMMNLVTNIFTDDLLYMKKEEFINFCMLRLKDSLEIITYNKYVHLLTPSTKQEFKRESESILKMLDWNLSFPMMNSDKFHFFKIMQKSKSSGKFVISVSLTPDLVSWLKV